MLKARILDTKEAPRNRTKTKQTMLWNTNLGHSLVGFGMYLVYNVAGPALDVIVLHRAVPAASYHVDIVAVVDDLVAKIFTISIAVAGCYAIADGGSKRHDTEPHTPTEPIALSMNTWVIIVLLDWAGKRETYTE